MNTQAYEMGRKARRDGKFSVPTLDTDKMTQRSQRGDMADFSRWWLSGWDEENRLMRGAA